MKIKKIYINLIRSPIYFKDKHLYHLCNVGNNLNKKNNKYSVYISIRKNIV
jgi:hypothetical protein